jgi:26S proteasome regulatory subunit N10
MLNAHQRKQHHIFTMPEASMLCIDSTEYMRNGDYFPNRLMGVQEASNLLCNAKMQQNQENTLGFLTFGGLACNVVETLTADVDRVITSITQVPLSGRKPHFARALQIASLALTHRINPRAEKRIIVFVGSPIIEDDQELTKLAKRLRKDNYAVDVVSFGVSDNVPILQAFIENVNKDGNSRLLVVQEGASITDSLMSSAVFLGNDAVAATEGGAGSAAAGARGAFDFGVDPSVDPELAMVLRMSMEEEMRRQEALAAQQAAPAAAPAVASQPSASVVEGTQELTEDEELALALKLSEEEEKAASNPPAVNAEALAALDDEEFMSQLQSSLEEKKPAKKTNDDES